MRKPRTSGLLATAMAVFMAVSVFAGQASVANAAPSYTTFNVYFPVFLQAGYYLYPVKYFVPATSSPATAAIRALIAGLPERGNVRFLNFPAGTTAAVSIADGVCTVNFNNAITAFNVGSGGEALIISSIVSTLSQFPSVNWVKILVEGQPMETLAGHVDISGPIARNTGTLFQVLSDVNQHWSGGAVAALELCDVIAGYEDATFRPEKTVTRAEFVKMLVEGLNLPENPSVPQPFTDVTGHWSAPYVQRAVASGMIKVADYGANFKPDEIIPRDEMASLLVYASTAYTAAHPEVQYNVVSPAPVFTDLSSADPRYTAAIQDSTRLGLLKGDPGGTFRPKSGLTRAESATVITRLMGMQATNSIARITPSTGFKWDGKSFSVLASAIAFEATVNLRLKTSTTNDVFDRGAWVNATVGQEWGVLGVYIDSALLGGQTATSFDLFLVSMKDGSEYETVALPLNLK